jgi:hypothetical protein
MRKLKIFFSILIVSTLLFSCKKKVDISIDTLSKSGEEFYFGEKVPVWAGTEGDKNGISYQWTATGGTFDGWRTQNLYENLWIAPDSVGEYTITATAKNGGSSSSKSMSMKVTRYFFDEFQSDYTFNGNGWSTSNTTNVLNNDVDPTKSSAEITAKSSSLPYISRNLDLSDLRIPFSVRVKLGWKKYYRDGQPITISLYFNQPANPNIPFIREIRWEIYPTADTAKANNYQIRFETFLPANNSSKFSSNGNVLPAPLPLINPVAGKYGSFKMKDGDLKSLSLSVDANNIFYAYVDGTLWFTSNGIKNWLEYAKATFTGFEEPLAKAIRISFPAKSGSKATTIVLKSVYINNDGEILK